MRPFLTIWAGQLVSLFGTSITGFGVGVWLYQETGSVMLFGLAAIANSLPGLLIGPFAGALVDRWPRRWAMLLSDAVAALSTFFLMSMLLFAELQPWHVYFAGTIGATAGAFQWPAYSAATTLLIPKRHLARASGLTQVSNASVAIVTPLVAGVLYERVGLLGLMTIDVATYLVAVVTLWIVRIPELQRKTPAGGMPSVLDDVREGWRYLTTRRPLLGLLAVFSVWNLFMATVTLLYTPLVLSFAGPEQLGFVGSVISVGVLAGSVTLSVWGGPARRVPWILALGVLASVFVMGSGLRPSVLLVSLTLSAAIFAQQLMAGFNQALWQCKTEPSIQGRVFAIRQSVALLSAPVSYLLAGVLADRVFEPMMAEGGLLAASAGVIFGVGPGRGLGLMITLAGAASMAVAAAALFYRPVRRLEDLVPDALDDEPPLSRPPEEAVITPPLATVPIHLKDGSPGD